VNGVPASEGYLNAQVAAEYGVAVVLVTGDDRTCADAATYAPQAHTVAVKDYVSRYAYSAVTAYEMIRCFKAVTTLIASAVEATYG
jgi:D-amino peptidase